jgi:hypothetical protein
MFTPIFFTEFIQGREYDLFGTSKVSRGKLN